MKRATPKSPLAASVGACVLAILAGISAPVSAGIPVIDGGHIATQIAEFQKEITRYQSMVEEWKSKLSQNPLDRLKEPANSRPKIGNLLTVKADSDGVEQRCNRDGSSNPIAAFANVFSVSFNANGNLREEQKKLCALQVTLENRKWNENVLMIKQQELLQEKLDAAADARKQGMTEGEINTSFGDMQVAQADYQVNLEKGQARIATLDNMISSVEHMQAMAAQQLLAGQRPNGFAAAAASSLAQGVGLKAALDIGNRQCGSELGVKCSN